MFKLIVCFLSAVFVSCVAVYAAPGDSVNVTVTTTLTYGVYDETGSSLLTYASYADGFSGLVQLIYAGVDGANSADNIGDGATGDDVVVGYSFVGFGYAPASRPGHFQPVIATLTDPAYVNGDQFFIRVWQDPSSSIGTGFAPTTEGSFYGDTALYTLGNMASPAPGDISFTFTSNLNTSLQSVPEPSTMALMAIGIASAGFYRRRKKNL